MVAKDTRGMRHDAWRTGSIPAVAPTKAGSARSAHHLEDEGEQQGGDGPGVDHGGSLKVPEELAWTVVQGFARPSVASSIACPGSATEATPWMKMLALAAQRAVN
jgi:hypothetical protein